MDWPPTLTQAQFEKGARAWASGADAQPSAGDELGSTQAARGWSWNAHEFAPALGFLGKTITVKLLKVMEDAEAELAEEPDVVSEVEDEGAEVAGSATAAAAFATATLSICYSPTYQVPVLYFNVFSHAGAPLPLPSILSSCLFQQHQRHAYPFTTIPDPQDISVTQNEASSSQLSASEVPTAATDAGAAPPAPFVSQAEHPALGTPAWFLHPCETQAIVAEVLSTRPALTKEDLAAGREWEREWVESWAMVVGGVVDLRG